jgi:hypothetical protein
MPTSLVKEQNPMKERLRDLLSEVGESFDYLWSDVRNLSRYMAELEKLTEAYRAFASNATLSTPTDRDAIRKLLKKTHKLLGPPPDKPPESRSQNCQETQRAAPLDERRAGTQIPALLPCEN